MKIEINNTYKTLGEILDETSIIVTHIPPLGLQDRIFLGLNSGSKNFRKIIDNYNPRLVLCGHIHENPGFTNYKKTIVVNCSIGKKGGGALIKLNNKINVKMLD